MMRNPVLRSSETKTATANEPHSYITDYYVVYGSKLLGKIRAGAFDEAAVQAARLGWLNAYKDKKVLIVGHSTVTAVMLDSCSGHVHQLAATREQAEAARAVAKRGGRKDAHANPRRNPSKPKLRLVWDETHDRGWASLSKHPDSRGTNDLWANEVRTVGNFLDYGKGSPWQSRGAAGNVMATAYLTRLDPSTRARHEHRLGSQWFATKREAKAWIAKKVWDALRRGK